MMTDLSSQAEAFLFSEGGPLSRKKLAHALGIEESELAPALTELSSRLSGRGLALILTDTSAALAIAPDAAQAVRRARENELGQEIGEAGLEVISIVLYRGPSTRSQIDYIRGVNTSSTIRTLMARGLLERAGNPEDGREYLYRPTVELLAHLGVGQAADLPEYAAIRAELASFEAHEKPGAESSYAE
ncbi:MAG: segregation and condensation protein segregation and condensation protein [Candidatus Parcubacteria bacterium]|jgi:segregation and condensation protein B